MGYYVDPPEGTKESWLEENGELTMTPSWPPPAGMVLVCLVDNGPFTAAAICYSEEEFDEFNDPDDPRPQKWYAVSRSDIIKVCPRVAERLS